MADTTPPDDPDLMRVGEAAEALGVGADTVRRWVAAGRLEARRSPGGQRLVERAAVARLARERRQGASDRPIVAQSARNRFEGIVTRVERDGVAAVVEVQAGPHRLVSMLTREAADELALEPGRRVVCVVKSTDVIVEITGRLIVAVRLVSLVLALSTVACAGPPATAPTSAAGPVELTVFAAASLRQSFERLGERYAVAAPGVRITFAFDASSAHRARIEQGARADVFASADVANPQALADGGLAAGPPQAFAGNALALVTPADDRGRIATPADLARPGVRIVAAGERVPITGYATELVTRLAALPGYPPDYAAKVAANVVTREDDVAAVVAKLELGEGDAGFVYATDVRRMPALRVVPIPPEAQVAARYAADPAQGRAAADGRAGIPRLDACRRCAGHPARVRLHGRTGAVTGRARTLHGPAVRASAGWLGAPAAILLVLFLALPVAALLARALLSGSVLRTLGERAIVDALLLSLATSGATLVIAVLLGTPLAFALARRRFRGSRLVETLVDLPIVLPPSVAGLALLLAFGRRGVAGEPLAALGVELPFTTLAVIVAQVFVATPLYVRSARAGFATVDRDLEDAARVDGAGEWQAFRHISAPLAAPALAAGLVLTWARALGEFGATILFAGNLEGRTQTLPLLVYSEFQDSLDASVAAATVLVVAALGVLVAVRGLGWRAGGTVSG